MKGESMTRKYTENQFDAYCKKVLRFKGITAMILKSIIKEFQNLSLSEIMTILNSDNITERMSVLNVEDITKPDSKIFYDLLYHIPIKMACLSIWSPKERYPKWNHF